MASEQESKVRRTLSATGADDTNGAEALKTSTPRRVSVVPVINTERSRRLSSQVSAGEEGIVMRKIKRSSLQEEEIRGEGRRRRSSRIEILRGENGEIYDRRKSRSCKCDILS